MNVTIVGNFVYGSSMANALRVRGLAEALTIEGHHVTIVDNVPEYGSEPTRTAVSQREGLVDIMSVDEYSRGLFSFLPRGVRGLFLGDVSARHVSKMGLRPDCIILYGPHLGYLARFRRLCNELSARLLLDIVEWYQPEDLPGGILGPYALSNEFSMRCATKCADGVIVLSARLERHYRGSGLPVINVPPMFTLVDAPTDKFSESDGRLHLCYAGTPGRKEALGLVLRSLQQAHVEGIDFVLHAVGMTAGDLSVALGDLDLSIMDPKLDRIRFYGQVPNQRAREVVSGSDFSLLLRPLRKANQFGFPSKLAESMATGTPVIANDFSDLGLYLKDSVNSIFIPDLNENDILGAIRRGARMATGAKRIMACQALQVAKASFSHAASARSLSNFIEIGK